MELSEIFAELHKRIVASGEPLEGNYVYTHRSLKKSDLLISKQRNLAEVARQSRFAMEIGFNAGHSASIMLSANPDLHLTCFDINSHRYTEPCAQFLKEVFGSRFEIVYGDSTVVVPKFDHQHLYDLAHIDGGHQLEVAIADWRNTYPCVRDGGIIVFDDTNAPHLRRLVQQQIMSRVVTDVSSSFERTKVYEHAILRKTLPGK
jgi:predicted O-methyltransferase YrrM